jgi:C-terminal processing protease CtpA/Prc
MSKLFWLVFVCFLPNPAMQAQDFSADEYVTGMTIVGKGRADPSCPPIVWVVEADTPAAKAGIQPGDRVLTIAGHSTTVIGTLEARPLLHTKDPTPITIELDGQHGPYSVTVGRIKASVLYARQGWKVGPDGGLYPENATEAEMKRISESGPEPPPSEKVFPVGHYPANLELYYPGFEVFTWKDRQSMTVGGIEDGPAQRSGVHYGDEIISVNGVNPRGKPMPELEQLFSSPKPATMTLIIDRDGTPKTFTFGLAKASDVAEANSRRMYHGRMIPSPIPPTYLHCFEPPPKPH